MKKILHHYIKAIIFFLLLYSLEGIEVNNVYQSVSYGVGWHLCHFNGPSVLVNNGSKIVVPYILDPKTNKWEETMKSTWSKNYLRFEGESDNVFTKLIILKPVTIAFTNFKGGPLDIAFSTLPDMHKNQSHPPINK